MSQGYCEEQIEGFQTTESNTNVKILLQLYTCNSFLSLSSSLIVVPQWSPNS